MQSEGTCKLFYISNISNCMVTIHIYNELPGILVIELTSNCSIVTYWASAKIKLPIQMVNIKNCPAIASKRG